MPLIFTPGVDIDAISALLNIFVSYFAMAPGDVAFKVIAADLGL